MLTTVQGVYRNGEIELLEPAPDIPEGRVLVKFLPEARRVDLAERGISLQEAGEMRVRLGSAVEDWEAPEMDVYDTL